MPFPKGTGSRLDSSNDIFEQISQGKTYPGDPHKFDVQTTTSSGGQGSSGAGEAVGVGSGSGIRGDSGNAVSASLAGTDIPAYDRLFAYTFAEAAGSLTVSIPSNYTTLNIVITGRTTGTGATSETIRMRFNADAAASYRYATIGSLNGAEDIVQDYTGATSMLVGVFPTADSPAGASGMAELQCGHLQSAFYKNVTSDGGGFFDTTPTNGMGVWSTFNQWASANPVVTLSIFPQASSFAIGTYIAIYGIR